MNRFAMVVVLIICAFWWTQYIAPKDAVLDAADACARGQHGQVWRTCLKQAEEKYGSYVLLRVGY